MGKCLGLVAVGALLLTGCASGEPEAAAPTVTVTATPEAAETAGPDTDKFLALATDQWRGEQVPTEPQLIEYGELVCETMRAGEAPPLVLPGESTADMMDNMSIIGAAQDELCPELL